MTPCVRVLIVDDHPAFRSGIVAVLAEEEGIEIVREAENTATALDVLEEDRGICVALVDLRMGKSSGGECTEAIRARFPQVNVIILTTYDGDPEAYRALRAGAVGYLLKSAPLEELIRVVKQVSLGKPQIPRELARELAELPHRPALTPREIDLLAFLGKGQTNKEAAHSMGIGAETVKSTLKSVFRKLQVQDRTQAVIVAMRIGVITRS